MNDCSAQDSGWLMSASDLMLGNPVSVSDALRGQRSAVYKVRVGTNGRTDVTDERTELIALPSSLMRSVKPVTHYRLYGPFTLWTSV